MSLRIFLPQKLFSVVVQGVDGEVNADHVVFGQFAAAFDVDVVDVDASVAVVVVDDAVVGVVVDAVVVGTAVY